MIGGKKDHVRRRRLVSIPCSPHPHGLFFFFSFTSSCDIVAFGVIHRYSTTNTTNTNEGDESSN